MHFFREAFDNANKVITDLSTAHFCFGPLFHFYNPLHLYRLSGCELFGARTCPTVCCTLYTVLRTLM